MNDLGELICHFAFLCVRQVLSPHTYMKLETNANVTISVLGYFGVCFFVFVWFFFACFVGFVGWFFFFIMASILLFTSRPNVFMYVHCILGDFNSLG